MLNVRNGVIVGQYDEDENLSLLDGTHFQDASSTFWEIVDIEIEGSVLVIHKNKNFDRNSNAHQGVCVSDCPKGRVIQGKVDAK